MKYPLRDGEREWGGERSVLCSNRAWLLNVDLVFGSAYARCAHTYPIQPPPKPWLSAGEEVAYLPGYAGRCTARSTLCLWEICAVTLSCARVLEPSALPGLWGKQLRQSRGVREAYRR